MPYCNLCNKSFTNQDALNQHKRDSPRHNEDSHWYCEKCQRFFDGEDGLHNHYKQSSLHHYCPECKRHFQSAGSLRSHRNSSKHQHKDVRCPFKKCGKDFVSRSALLHHLESGGCPSRVDRVIVDRFVRQYDKNHLITDRLITGPGGLYQITTWAATEEAWNGRSYECYLCHKTFRTLNALNQHLASPTHQEDVYFCPLQSCRVRFTTLSGLCQHIESQKCGVSKFKQVQRTLDGFFGGMKRLTAA